MEFCSRCRKQFDNNIEGLKTCSKCREYKKQYKVNNSEAYISSYKTYYENNKNMLREKNKKYKDEHKEYMYEQIICNICGGQICRHGLTRHQKTKKCKSFVKLTENDNYIIVDGRTYLKGESPLEGVWHKDHTPVEVKHYAIIEKNIPRSVLVTTR